MSFMIKADPRRHWLMSAFEPFANREKNNSLQVLEEIKKLTLEVRPSEKGPFQFHYLVLPVEYETCFQILKDETLKLQKNGINLEGILALGEGAEEFKIETQANNLDDVPEVPDNKGETRSAHKIFAEYSEEHLLPLRFPFEAFSRIRSSKNPGYYICNHLCAKMSYHFGKTNEIPYFGFIHVPQTGSGGVFTPDVCATVILNSFKKIKTF